MCSSDLIFIGPSPESIRTMGDKVAAIEAMQSAGVPCVPGSDGPLGEDADLNQQLAKKVGYPIIIKAAGGGGGRGMRVVHSDSTLQRDRKRTRLNSSHQIISYAVFCLKNKRS